MSEYFTIDSLILYILRQLKSGFMGSKAGRETLDTDAKNNLKKDYDYSVDVG
jgi:hypothetical protein